MGKRRLREIVGEGVYTQESLISSAARYATGISNSARFSFILLCSTKHPVAEGERSCNSRTMKLDDNCLRGEDEDISLEVQRLVKARERDTRERRRI